MIVTEDQLRMVNDFREWMESAVSGILQKDDFERHDHQDRSAFINRWMIQKHIWHEITIRPSLPQVRVGIMTDDPYRHNDFKQLIDGSGDTMQEFIQEGFASAGLEWRNPPVHNYCEQGVRYYISTPLDLRSVDQLVEELIRNKMLEMVQGYQIAFFGTAG